MLRDPVTLARLPDWRPRLVAYLAAAPGERFSYGARDCATFAAGAVAAMTGVDLAEDYRGRYLTFAGGVKLLRQAGFIDLLDVVTAHFQQIERPMAAMGDLVTHDTYNGPALGVVAGGGAFMALEERGMMTLDMRHAAMAFRV